MVPGEPPAKKVPRSPTDPAIGLKNVDDYEEFSDAEQAMRWARQTLGIGNVEYGGRRDIANLVNRAVCSLQRRGLPMPQGLVVTDSPERFAPEAVAPEVVPALVPAAYDWEERVIYLNPNDPTWSDGGAMIAALGAVRYLATDDPHHAVLHECGHHTHRTLSEAAWFDDDGEDRSGELWDALIDDLAPGREVSDRALYDYREFVAEVFAGLALGRRFSEAVMTWYDNMGGPHLAETPG